MKNQANPRKGRALEFTTLAGAENFNALRRALAALRAGHREFWRFAPYESKAERDAESGMREAIKSGMAAVRAARAEDANQRALWVRAPCRDEGSEAGASVWMRYRHSPRQRRIAATRRICKGETDL